MFCKFCSKECKNKNSLRNHQRLCPNNPDRKYVSHTLSSNGFVPWNKGLTKETDRRIQESADAVSKAMLANPRILTDEQKRHLSAVAKSKGLGGYRENAGRSKKFKVFDSLGNNVTLQSTYELKCAELLNELGIKWIRPKALKYDGRNYFADFYLIDYDLYLDPKNSFKARQDQLKIQKVVDQNKVKVYVLLDHQLTKEFIQSLCS